MTRNAWRFTVGHLQWLPIARSEQSSPDWRHKWLAEATERARVTALAPEEDEPMLRERCERALDAAPEGEAFVFFALGEALPAVVAMSTASAGDTLRMAVRWASGDDAVVSIDPVPGVEMHDGRRIVRVSRRPDGGLHFATGFFGSSGDLGLGMTMVTDAPLVAAQFAHAGSPLFASMSRR